MVEDEAVHGVQSAQNPLEISKACCLISQGDFGKSISVQVQEGLGNVAPLIALEHQHSSHDKNKKRDIKNPHS